MRLKSISAKSILNSRKERTIEVSLSTNIGRFSASVPSGKSTGKHEEPPYRQSLQRDIRTLRKFSILFRKKNPQGLEDIERIIRGKVGANTLLALEYSFLKAFAREQEKQVWQILSSRSRQKKFPKFVGNCIGGGLHTKAPKKPDFQEFLLIHENPNLIKKAYDHAKQLLKKYDLNFKGKKNDENAWVTSLGDKSALDILYRLQQDFGVKIGLDVAASSFYKRKKYLYKNPKLCRNQEEQEDYIRNLIKNYSLFYVEDPFEEDDFESFARLTKSSSNCLVVGDDLIVTNFLRLKKAIKKNSLNAVIIKPNQIGSLLEVRKVCILAKQHGIKLVFSHRSGETNENILADLAVAFQADFFKVGIVGKERESKIKRMLEIQKSLK